MWLKYWAVLVSAFVSASALGQKATPAEMAQVPEYCRYTQTFREEYGRDAHAQNLAHWNSVLGAEQFSNLHHYCYGMIQLMRAQDYRITPQRRANILGQALGDIDYSINRVPPDYVLLPEMYTKRARVLVLQKKVVDAVDSFMKAISLKPDYWPPYAELSDLYKANGDRTKAQAILEEGLKNIPGSKTLEARMKALGEKH